MAEMIAIHTIAPIAISLEILVNHIREAHTQHDIERRNCLIEMVLQRTQASNERWANSLLQQIDVLPGERSALALYS